MNKQRRKEIYQNIGKLETACVKVKSDYYDDILSLLTDIASDVDCIRSDEECYMDNIPENLQNGIRYEIAEEACENLEDAISSIEDAISNIDDTDELLNNIKCAINYLNDAAQ